MRDIDDENLDDNQDYDMPSEESREENPDRKSLGEKLGDAKDAYDKINRTLDKVQGNVKDEDNATQKAESDGKQEAQKQMEDAKNSPENPANKEIDGDQGGTDRHNSNRENGKQGNHAQQGRNNSNTGRNNGNNANNRSGKGKNTGKGKNSGKGSGKNPNSGKSTSRPNGNGQSFGNGTGTRAKPDTVSGGKTGANAGNGANTGTSAGKGTGAGTTAGGGAGTTTTTTTGSAATGAGGSAAGAGTAAGSGAAGASTGAAAAGGSTAGAAAGTGILAGAGAAIATAVVVLVIVIIILIILVGAYFFFTTMPGMFLDKITEISSGMWANFKEIFVGSSAQISEKDEIQLATYLENMGYDLYTYGFGEVERDESGEIRKVNNDYLFSYLLSDYNTYAVTGKFHEDFTSMWHNIFFWCTNEPLNGMIQIDHNGKWDAFVDSIKQDIEIDRATKKMTIGIGWPILGKQYYTFDIDGWSGRYGKPLEFLLTMHLSTMAPDLALEFASNEAFDTKVHVELEDIDAYIRLQFVMAADTLSNMQADSYYHIWDMDGMESLEGKSIYEKEDLNLIAEKLKEYEEYCKKYEEKKKKDKDKKDSDTTSPTDEEDEEEGPTSPTDEEGGPTSPTDEIGEEFDESKSIDRLQDILNYMGLSEAQIRKVNEINNESEKGTKVSTVQPYITYVENAWYRDIYFVRTKSQLSDEEKADYPDAGENDIIFNAYKVEEGEREMAPYTFEPQAGSNEEILSPANMGGAEFQVIETRTKVRTQTQQPIKGKTNQKTKELLIGAQNETSQGTASKPMYYIYDGTEQTADEIKRLKEIQSELNKQYSGEELSKEIDKEDKYNVYREIDFDKSSLTAFSILQNMKTKDADFILRDLKELLVELEYFKKSDFETPDTQVLTWILPNYNPKQWPNRETEKQVLEYGTLIKASTGEGNNEVNGGEKGDTGFETNIDVVAPGIGKIVKNGADYIEIEFTDPEIVAGMTMYISGFQVDLSEAEYDDNGNLVKGTRIGFTTSSDIKVILRDSGRNVLENVEDYMVPPSMKSNGFVNNPVGEDVTRWRDMVIDALAELGLDTSEDTVSRVLQQIANESSGDPNAVNDWDSNASSDCSVGVLQCIASTYNAYKRPEDPEATAFTAKDYHSGNYNQNDPRFNGYYNIYASINYCANRYGRDLSIWPTTKGY